MVEIVGRTDELELLRRFVRATATNPRALVLDGPAGIGKSTLWGAAVSAAQQGGSTVLTARPMEPERDLPFAGLGDLLEPYADTVLPMLVPPRRRALEGALLLAATDEGVDPRALGVALRDCLGLLADRGVIVAIDDVQWLDEGSAMALAFALARSDASIRFLFARRSGVAGAGSDIARGLPDRAVAKVPVGALSLGATQAMLTDRLRRTFARSALLRIHSMSAGNPFYALEIARALDDSVDPVKPLPIPDSLEELMSRRLAALPDATRIPLGVVAANGDLESELIRTMGVSEAAVHVGIEAHVLGVDDSRLAFTHPLLATAAYVRLLPSERRRIHEALARAVTEPVRRARHLALAVDEPDVDVAATLDAAADQALARGAIAVAAELRDHALRLTPDHARSDRHRRTIGLARAQHANGNHTAAEALARGLVDDSRPGTERATAVLLLYSVVGNVTNLTELLASALPDAVGDVRLATELHALLARELSFDGHYDAADRHASEAVELAERVGDPLLSAESLWTLAAQRGHSGAQDAVELVHHAFDVSSRLDDPVSITRLADTISGGVTFWSGHHERLRELLEPACAKLTESDELVLEAAMYKLAACYFVAGRLHEAEATARRTLDMSKTYGVDGPGSRIVLALICAYRGLHDEAGWLARAERSADESMPWVDAQAEGILGRLELWNGAPDRACEHFDAAERLPSCEPAIRRWRAEYVESLLALGRRDEAITVVDDWARAATPLGRRVVSAEVARCRGLLAAADGRTSDAESLFEDAVDESEALGDPIGQARALLAIGRVRRRRKQKRGSRMAFEAAAALFDECGSDAFAKTARSEITTLSGRRRQEGLTQAERRVADLAADGRTNRGIAAELFLSVSTVETHLSHVYAKLGIRSRAQLARALDVEPGGTSADCAARPGA